MILGDLSSTTGGLGYHKSGQATEAMYQLALLGYCAEHDMNTFDLNRDQKSSLD